MIIYNRIVFNNVYQYYTPLYPCGFIIKIEIDSNYGDKRLVGFDKIEIVDVMKREVVKERNVNIINISNVVDDVTIVNIICIYIY
jgi:hypothetical protein